MAAFTKFNVLPLDLATKQHNLNADALKVMLSNVAPVATNAVLTDLTEIAAGFGYVAGGNAAAFVSGAQAGGVYKLVLSVVDFIAAGGSIASFRYPVLYNSANSKLIGWWDYGVSIIITNGNKFELQTDPVNGVLTLA
jgi:hypothetical protein